MPEEIDSADEHDRTRSEPDPGGYLASILGCVVGVGLFGVPTFLLVRDTAEDGIYDSELWAGLFYLTVMVLAGSGIGTAIVLRLAKYERSVRTGWIVPAVWVALFLISQFIVATSEAASVAPVAIIVSIAAALVARWLALRGSTD